MALVMSRANTALDTGFQLPTTSHPELAAALLPSGTTDRVRSWGVIRRGHRHGRLGGAGVGRVRVPGPAAEGPAGEAARGPGRADRGGRSRRPARTGPRPRPRTGSSATPGATRESSWPGTSRPR